MVPSQQRLRHTNVARGHVHDGLVVQMELVLNDGGAQIADQAQAFLRGGLQALREMTEPIASLALRHIHGLVCALEKFLHLGRVLWIHGYANAGGHIHHGVAKLKWLSQALDNFLRDNFHMCWIRYA